MYAQLASSRMCRVHSRSAWRVGVQVLIVSVVATLAKFWGEVNHFRAMLFRFAAKSTDHFGSVVARPWSEVDHSRAMLANSWARSATFGNVGELWGETDHFGRGWPLLVRIRPLRGSLRQCWDEFARCWSLLEPIRPNACEADQFRAMSVDSKIRVQFRLRGKPSTCIRHQIRAIFRQKPNVEAGLGDTLIWLAARLSVGASVGPARLRSLRGGSNTWDQSPKEGSRKIRREPAMQSSDLGEHRHRRHDVCMVEQDFRVASRPDRPWPLA